MPLLANAAIYKSVDADGNVVFSDTPLPGGKEVILPPTPTYTPRPLAVPAAGAGAGTTQAPTAYTSLLIVSPADGATIRDNTGAVAVNLVVEPPMTEKSGHKLVVILDGKPQESAGNSTQVTLSDVERGSHTLRASILNADGQVQFSSGAVTFHLKRESILQPRNPPGITPKPNINPNKISDNPNVRSFTTNKDGTITPTNPGNISKNPNKLSDNPNIINPAPTPAPKPAI